MAFYSARGERERRERDTPERILDIAKAKGQFTVSLRYRDDWLRSRLAKMRKAGLLRGGKRHGSMLVYYAAVDPASPSQVTATSGPANVSARNGSADGKAAE